MSQKKQLTGGQKALRVLVIVLCTLIALVLLLLVGVRAYFRIPVSEYYKNSEKAFVIPGLSDGMIHQGLAYDDASDTFLITGYRADGAASQLSLVSKAEGKEVKRLSLANADGSAFTGHVGGITLHGDYVYVADVTGLVVFRKSDVENASSGDSIQSVGFFETTTADDILRVSFTHIEGDTLYVGEFYRAQNYPTPDSHKYITAAGDENTALILAYPLDDTAPLGISNAIRCAYSIPDLVQGMCFDDNGNICLSTSYAVAFSHIRIYNARKEEGTVTVLGQTVPRYVLDSSTMVQDIKLAPMAEEIAAVDGKLYTMCESATNKYIFGKFTSAKYCYATDLAKYGTEK